MKEGLKVIIITGLSGAGKTQAVRCFEDLGYFCIDNLPPNLIPKFAELTTQTSGQITHAALVMDVRGGGFFDSLFEALNYLKESGILYEILFLEASDETLVKRFKETRRMHPMAIQGRIIEGIKAERRRLKELKARADHIIDTSNLTPIQLKWEITARVVKGRKREKIIITILSFGYKHGIPSDVDMVFDVRFLPNPYYVEELKPFSGNDERVYDYVLKQPQSEAFLKKVEDMIEFLIPHFIKEGKTQLVIGIGCTGGRHRSVAIARALTLRLRELQHSAVIEHRDIYQEEAAREDDL